MDERSLKNAHLKKVKESEKYNRQSRLRKGDKSERGERKKRKIYQSSKVLYLQKVAMQAKVWFRAKTFPAEATWQRPAIYFLILQYSSPLCCSVLPFLFLVWSRVRPSVLPFLFSSECFSSDWSGVSLSCDRGWISRGSV